MATQKTMTNTFDIMHPGRVSAGPKSKGSIADSYKRPCYENLRTNAPTPLIEMSLNSWKRETELYARHSVVAHYIQETAAKTGVDRTILHNTKVESVSKGQSGWKVHTLTWGTATGVLPEEWVS